MKRLATDWEKININIKSHIWWGTFILCVCARTCVRVCSYNSMVRKRTSQLQNGKKPWTESSPKKRYVWPISRQKILNTREMQIKTTNSYRNWKWKNIKGRWGCRVIVHVTVCWWKWKMIEPLQKPTWHFLVWLDIYLLEGLAIPFLCSFSKEMKTLCPYKDMYVNIYRTEHNPYVHQLVKKINEGWDIHTIEYSFPIKKKEQPVDTYNIADRPQNLMQHERIQTLKSTYCMIPFLCHSGKCKTIGTEIKSVVTRAWGEGGDWIWRGKELLGVMAVFCTLILVVVVFIWQYILIRTHWTVHL